MHELHDWKSRLCGPEHFANWERQLNYILANPETSCVRVINIDEARNFIKKINGVT